MVRHHHERMDGTGYPAGLSGEAIPVGARILAVADTFDAITSTRPYRHANAHKKALDILASEAGSQLDPDAVRAFCRCYSGRKPLAYWSLLVNARPQIVSFLGGGLSPASAASFVAPGATAAAVGAVALSSLATGRAQAVPTDAEVVATHASAIAPSGAPTPTASASVFSSLHPVAPDTPLGSASVPGGSSPASTHSKGRKPHTNAATPTKVGPAHERNGVSTQGSDRSAVNTPASPGAHNTPASPDAQDTGKFKNKNKGNHGNAYGHSKANSNRQKVKGTQPPASPKATGTATGLPHP